MINTGGIMWCADNVLHSELLVVCGRFCVTDHIRAGIVYTYMYCTAYITI